MYTSKNGFAVNKDGTLERQATVIYTPKDLVDLVTGKDNLDEFWEDPVAEKAIALAIQSENAFDRVKGNPSALLAYSKYCEKIADDLILLQQDRLPSDFQEKIKMFLDTWDRDSLPSPEAEEWRVVKNLLTTKQFESLKKSIEMGVFPNVKKREDVYETWFDYDYFRKIKWYVKFILEANSFEYVSIGKIVVRRPVNYVLALMELVLNSDAPIENKIRMMELFYKSIQENKRQVFLNSAEIFSFPVIDTTGYFNEFCRTHDIAQQYTDYRNIVNVKMVIHINQYHPNVFQKASEYLKLLAKVEKMSNEIDIEYANNHLIQMMRSATYYWLSDALKVVAKKEHEVRSILMRSMSAFSKERNEHISLIPMVSDKEVKALNSNTNGFGFSENGYHIYSCFGWYLAATANLAEPNISNFASNMLVFLDAMSNLELTNNEMIKVAASQKSSFPKLLPKK